MIRTLLKSKIHQGIVTNGNIDYKGSIGIDKELCKAADIKEFEKVDIYSPTYSDGAHSFLINVKILNITNDLIIKTK